MGAFRRVERCQIFAAVGVVVVVSAFVSVGEVMIVAASTKSAVKLAASPDLQRDDKKDTEEEDKEEGSSPQVVFPMEEGDGDDTPPAPPTPSTPLTNTTKAEDTNTNDPSEDVATPSATLTTTDTIPTETPRDPTFSPPDHAPHASYLLPDTTGSLSYAVTFPPSTVLDGTKAVTLFTPIGDGTPAPLDAFSVTLYGAAGQGKAPRGFIRPIFVSPHEKGQFVAKFFMDDADIEYRLVATLHGKSVATTLHWKGGNQKCAPPGNATSVLRRALPLPFDFHLVDATGHVWEEQSTLTLSTQETTRMWITPRREAMEVYPLGCKNAAFLARLTNDNVRTTASVEYVWDEEKHGYAIDFRIRDPGTYSLLLNLVWFFGKKDLGETPPPQLVGTHFRYQYIQCNDVKSRVFEKFTVVVKGPPVSPPAPPRKCRNGEGSEGRWLFLKHGKPCVPPYCTGDRQRARVSKTSNDRPSDWVWVPFDCHLHAYSNYDILTCAREKNIKWIHVMGDSQTREIPATLYSHYTRDSNKFGHADMLLNGTLRVSFKAMNDVIQQMDDKNSPSKRPRKIEETRRLIEQTHIPGGADVTRPDVLILNPGMAYSAMRMTMPMYAKWSAELAQYFLALQQTPTFRQPHPLQLIWYEAPYLFSQAHGGSNPLTMERAFFMYQMSRQPMHEAGFTVLDVWNATKARPDGAYDGLHYLRGNSGTSNGGYWKGDVANWVIQIVFNTIFGDCPKT